MKLRPVLFWAHLVCGVAAGLVIALMSVTGALLTYEKQTIAWADRRAAAVDATRPRLPVESLVASVRDATGESPMTVALSSAPGTPALVSVRQRTLVVDPTTGAVVGESAPRLRRFFRGVTDWHRWLAVNGEGRPTARIVTGWSNAIFLFIVLSGAYLWIPRVWSWRHVKAVALFNPRASGKARDFNWHNVIGVWSVVPLAIVVATALPMSFSWANAMIYRAVGEAPPQAGRPGGGGPGGPGGGPGAGAAAGRGRGGEAQPPAVPLTGLAAAWARAEGQTPDWRTITLRLPASPQAPYTFTIDRGGAGQPQYRGTLTVNAGNPDEARWEPFAALSTGRRIRSLSRFLHTGEALGVVGQTIAGLASAGGAVLVWTGLALAWRRFVRWRSRPEADAGQIAA